MKLRDRVGKAQIGKMDILNLVHPNSQSVGPSYTESESDKEGRSLRLQSEHVVETTNQSEKKRRHPQNLHVVSNPNVENHNIDSNKRLRSHPGPSPPASIGRVDNKIQR